MTGSTRLVTAAAAVVLAAGITGCSSSSGGSAASSTTADAATSTSSTTTTTSTSTSSTGSIANPIVHLSATFTGHNGVDEPITVAFDGSVNDTGTATQTVKGGTQGESGTIEFKLAKGTITASFVEPDFQMNFDAAACRATPTSSGTITIATGTGDYLGAVGKLTFSTAGTMVGATDTTGACLGTSKPPVSSVVVLNGVGPVTFTR